MRIYVFGCYAGRPGHVVRKLEGTVLLPVSCGMRTTSIISVIQRSDGLLPPLDPRERQGRYIRHWIHGFTVLAWWDRSIDTRPGSNAGVWIEGTYSPAETFDIARKHVGMWVSRLPYELVWADAEKATENPDA